MNKLAEVMIKQHEGLRLFVYVCSAGKQTIGYGRNIDTDGGKGLSIEECEYLLRNDIDQVTKHLQYTLSIFHFLNEARQAVLISMVYNLGLNGFSKFKKMLKALHNLDYAAAAKEMLDSRWAIQVGQRANDLAEIMASGKIK